jgi:serine/threonine-protein kinase ULK2
MSILQTSLQDGNPKAIAGYVLKQKLGSGSFATVYKGVKIAAEEENNDADTVAIKVITRMSEKLTKKVLENLEMEVSHAEW